MFNTQKLNSTNPPEIKSFLFTNFPAITNKTLQDLAKWCNTQLINKEGVYEKKEIDYSLLPFKDRIFEEVYFYRENGCRMS